MRRKKDGNPVKKIIIILVVILLAVLVGIVYKLYFGKDKTISLGSENVGDDIVNTTVVEEKTVQIYKGQERPIAVMLDNNKNAWPHAAINKAYMVYEIIVEGGESRLMALFKGQTFDKVGPIRSSRHYFLDYALENDAIYVHFGWSPQAQELIGKLGVNNINGLYDDAFWRDNPMNLAYEHTAYTSMDKIMKVAKNKGYRLTSEKDLLLNYSADEVSIENEESSLKADNVSIRYSNVVTTSYKYNPTDKLYYRSVNGSVQKDYVTKKQYTTKNIIISYVDNGNISNDNKGRQELNNIGTGKGYYITDGYSIPITWTKTSRNEQTVYKKLNGEEITVNDGNTFIQIAPKDSAKIS